MNKFLLLHTGAAAALLAPHTDHGPKILVNDGPNARFTAAGRYVEVGETYPADEATPEGFIAKSTPVGALTDEQLLAAVAQRGLTPNPGAPANEPAAAPVAPGTTSQTELDELDKKRAEEAASAAEAARASAQAAADAAAANPPDRDGDGKPGGSRSKAEIAAELTSLGIEFDGRASRDDLAKLLDDAEKSTDPK